MIKEPHIVDIKLLNWPCQKVQEVMYSRLTITDTYIEKSLSGYFIDTDEELGIEKEEEYMESEKCIKKEAIFYIGCEKSQSTDTWHIWLSANEKDSIDIWFSDEDHKKCKALYKQLKEWWLG